MIKWVWRGLLGVLVAVVVAVGAGLIYAKIVQSDIEARLAITTPGGVDDALFVPINGREHWITIRGRQKSNPVLFMLHGGPGGAHAPMAAELLGYERDYTVVQWDQPGAARTFRRAGNSIPPDLTIDALVDDGLAVAEFVKARLDADKLILLGFSWGSILGIEMARKRPDLFVAYVGTGQLVSSAENEARAYADVLAKARTLGLTDAVTELEAIGAPPYASYDEFATERKWAAAVAGGAPSVIWQIVPLAYTPRYSILDSVSYVRGFLTSQTYFVGGEKLDGPAMTINLNKEPMTFEIPIVIIQGAEDNVTPSDLARGYLDRISAPYKAYVEIDGAGHGALVEKSELFLAALDEHLRAVRP